MGSCWIRSLGGIEGLAQSDNPGERLSSNARCSVGERRSASTSRTRAPEAAIAAPSVAAVVDLPSACRAEVNKSTGQPRLRREVSVKIVAWRDVTESTNAWPGFASTTLVPGLWRPASARLNGIRPSERSPRRVISSALNTVCCARYSLSKIALSAVAKAQTRVPARIRTVLGVDGSCGGTAGDTTEVLMI